MYYSYTEDFVKKLYTRISINRPEELSYQNISRELKILLYYWEEPSQALLQNKVPYIILNKNLTDQQKWQDYCHELAHLLLHAGDQSKLHPLFIEYQEYKANHFMYHAAIPTFMLENLEREGYSCSIKQIQEIFNVEYEFAKHRFMQYMNKKNTMKNTLRVAK